MPYPHHIAADYEQFLTPGSCETCCGITVTAVLTAEMVCYGSLNNVELVTCKACLASKALQDRILAHELGRD